MKNVVQEVLNRNNKSPSNKKVAPSAPVHRQNEGSRKVTVKSDETSDNDLSAINRPNYQNQKRKNRLLPTETGVKLELTDSVSQLSTLSLVQGNKPREQAQPYSRQVAVPNSKPVFGSNTVTKPQQIGKTKDGSYVWYFPDVDQGLKSLFRGKYNSQMVGVVTSEKCYPSHLFLVDEVLREIPKVEYHMLWDKENNQGFVLELFMNDEKQLNNILKEIYQKLNLRALKGIEAYSSVSPSAWLSRQLKLDSSHPAVAVLEGIPYYKSVAILDHYFKRNPTMKLNFMIENEYLILMGESQIISQAIDTLKQEASR